MTHLASPREAEEFLIGRIVDQAQRENVPLSDVERKMLYFTESGWTLPDMMDVAEKFDEDYDQFEYERKIARLAEHAMKRAREEGQIEEWRDAVRALHTEDHYLSVMIGQASAAVRPPHDRLKLWATAFALVAAFTGVSLVAGRYNIELGKYIPSRSDFDLYLWVGMMSVFALLVLGSAFGDARFTNFIYRLVEKAADWRRNAG